MRFLGGNSDPDLLEKKPMTVIATFMMAAATNLSYCRAPVDMSVSLDPRWEIR